MFEGERIGWNDLNDNPLCCGDKVRLFGKDEYLGEISYDETTCAFVIWVKDVGVWGFDDLRQSKIERI